LGKLRNILDGMGWRLTVRYLALRFVSYPWRTVPEISK
jgi:hypothetical protein